MIAANDNLLIRSDVEPAVPALALRAREAAKALGVSERTLWAWTEAGDVPHVKRGRMTLYPVAGLRAWLAAQQQGGQA